MDDDPHRIPIIDVGALVEGAAQTREVARAIGRACRETGFFYVAGHGIAPELVRRVFALSQQFFAMPLAQKERAAFPDRRATAAGSGSATRRSIPASRST